MDGERRGFNPETNRGHVERADGKKIESNAVSGEIDVEKSETTAVRPKTSPDEAERARRQKMKEAMEARRDLEAKIAEIKLLQTKIRLDGDKLRTELLGQANAELTAEQADKLIDLKIQEATMADQLRVASLEDDAKGLYEKLGESDRDKVLKLVKESIPDRAVEKKEGRSEPGRASDRKKGSLLSRLTSWFSGR